MAPRECKGPRLFVEGLREWGAVEPNTLLSLSPHDSHYLKDVLRLSVGSFVEIGDPNTGETFKATIASASDGITLSIVEKLDTTCTDISITVLCALCKGQKNELITDWATELGCSQIIFWQADRSIVRLKNDGDAEAKARKFSKAALAAAQQSRQALPPRVMVTTSLTKALSITPATPNSLKVCCSLEHDAPPLSELARGLQPGSSISIVIGPEGDLTPEELGMLHKDGFKPASLGRQVLRSELAVVTAITTIKNAPSA
jgi:16S rRNA (uracil1498-N3)-methyltransferase